MIALHTYNETTLYYKQVKQYIFAALGNINFEKNFYD